MKKQIIYILLLLLSVFQITAQVNTTLPPFDVSIPPCEVVDSFPAGTFVSEAERGSWGYGQLRIGQIKEETGLRGKGVKIAVLDTGGGYHPDLIANIVDTISYVPNEWTRDLNGHGNHCSGIASAVANELITIGVADEADLYPGKVLANSGSGRFSWVEQGYQWAFDNKVDIISMSLGGSQAPASTHAQANKAEELGIIQVAAAGNSGKTIADEESRVGDPARNPFIIAVASYRSDGTISNFSSEGPEVFIAAPGERIYSLWKEGGTANISGTSMACPFVAGVIALLIEKYRKQNIRLSPQNVRDMLRVTAIDAGAPGFDPFFGWGKINPWALLVLDPIQLIDGPFEIIEPDDPNGDPAPPDTLDVPDNPDNPEEPETPIDDPAETPDTPEEGKSLPNWLWFAIGTTGLVLLFVFFGKRMS